MSLVTSDFHEYVSTVGHNTCVRSRIDWRHSVRIHISRRGARCDARSNRTISSSYRIRFRMLAAWTVASAIDTVDRSVRIYLSTIYTARKRMRIPYCMCSRTTFFFPSFLIVFIEILHRFHYLQFKQSVVTDSGRSK